MRWLRYLALQMRLLATVIAIAGRLTAPVLADEKAAEKPLPSAVEAALILKDIDPGAPVYIRVFKEESELEVWKAREDGRYALIKTFPVCNWGGTLGPKQTTGDLMSPEGFYSVTAGRLNPDSKYHLAFNIGYPNALDRALGRTGSAIMVHGDCRSVGCFAMSNQGIEEIYAFVRDSLAAGETSVPVHVFPFRMNAANMKRHADNPARTTWGPLKEAYDDFTRTREPPEIGMCGRRYVVNSLSPVGDDPNAACPTLIGKRLAPLSPRSKKRLVKTDPSLEAQGQKLKGVEVSTTNWESYLLGTTLSPGGVKPAPSKQSIATSSDASLGAVQSIVK
ncbi:murein L,D-transpeptidase family protein [Hyphomicrobium sp.]|uniref:L,D-transpeptidase family protein n=1 Tax=Hyphomicrobium sp. TaxID=82 RepID=UPI000FB07C23|nr:murein L,D-transpeptidase family protein [Hyphomicrobium sp.]RUP00154.1 MAG: murein L,D-transpeptidase [Hyphomicrobium sp.]